MSKTIMSLHRVCSWIYHYKFFTLAVVVNMSPLANLTVLVGIGTVANLASFTKLELMKLCELPESSKVSITLSCMRALSFIELSVSILESAFRDKWQKSCARVSSIASWFSISSIISSLFVSRSLITNAWTWALWRLGQFSWWLGSNLSPQAKHRLLARL